MATRIERIEKNNIMRFGKFYMLIGLSIILGIVSSKIILQSEKEVSRIFSTISIWEMVLIIIGLILLFEGIYFFSLPETAKLNILIFWPYIIFLSSIWLLYINVDINGGLIEISNIFLNILLITVWFAVLFEVFKLVIALKDILNKRVIESEDRLSIILTMVGTIIAALALLK